MPVAGKSKRAKEPTKPRAPRKKKGVRDPGSRGIEAREAASGDVPAEVAALRAAIEADGGASIGAYRDPLGGHWLLLAVLPVEKVVPTPYQRDLSATHVVRLAKAIEDVDRFLDPVIVVRTAKGEYWTPNGLHRSEAMKRLGARAVTCLVVPEADTAYRILALNTEKAHNLREKALEVIRMAKDLALLGTRPEEEHAVSFEDPALLTLGLCYEERPRFSGGAYHPVLKRVETFLKDPLPRALERRRERMRMLLALDDAVAAAVGRLQALGMESPYLRNFVVARVNPIRFSKSAAEFEPTIEKMLAAAKAFDASKIRADQVARSGGPPPGTE
jgi:ParB family chromosome partitioning protein